MDPSASDNPFGDDGSVFATFTSSAIDAIATAINETWGDDGQWDGGDQITGDSGTIIDPIAGEAPNEGSYVLVSTPRD